MNKIKCTFYIFTLMTLFVVMQGCDKKEKNKTGVDYLLPDLRDKTVHGIELSSVEGATTLARRDGIWWVESPVDYLAEQNAIESFLRTLTDAEIGKRIKVSKSDYGKLSVGDDDGVRARILYGDDKEVSLIIGLLSFPDDTSSSGLLGAGYSARRYIRVLGKNEAVYLVPISLVDLSATPTIWTNTSLIRIASFKRLIIKSGEGVAQEYRRNTMFGPLYRVGSNGIEQEVEPGLFKCLEELLTVGECFAVGDADSVFKERESLPDVSLVLEDFLGAIYTLRFGETKKPTEQEQARAELAMGFLSRGIASEAVAFTLNESIVPSELNPIESARLHQNKGISKRLTGRVAYLDLRSVRCLIEFLEDIL